MALEVKRTVQNFALENMDSIILDRKWNILSSNGIGKMSLDMAETFGKNNFFILLKFFIVKVGDGANTFIWWGPWPTSEPMCNREDLEALEEAGIDPKL